MNIINEYRNDKDFKYHALWLYEENYEPDYENPYDVIASEMGLRAQEQI